MKNSMRPREMALFAAMCQTGSVTQAALAVGLTQPGASAMLRELEDRVGTALFSRKRRRLELTASGRSLLPEVLHALAALDSVEKMVQSMGRGTGRQLTIGTVSAGGASVIPHALHRLQQADPNCMIAVKTGTATEVIEMAVQQRISLGVVLGSGVHEHVGFEKLADLGLVCVVRKDHPWANKSSIEIEELANTSYIAHSRHLPVGTVTAQAIEAAGHTWNPNIEVMQFSGACALTDAGCGPAVLDSLTGVYAERLGLVPIRLRVNSKLSLNLVWPLSKGLSPAARFVAAEIRRTVAQALHSNAAPEASQEQTLT